MPELPDVEVFARHIEAHALGRRVAYTQVLEPRILADGLTPQSLGRYLKAQPLQEVHRHGKHLLVGTDAGWLVLHFGMTGQVYFLEKAGDTPKFTRVLLDFDKGASLAVTSRRMLGHVDFFQGTAEEYAAEKNLGPDALAGTLDGKAFANLFQGRSGMVKPLLMNQSILAGVGSVYADETLYQAKVHPAHHTDKLDESTYQSIFRAMRRVLRTSADNEVKAVEFPQHYLLYHRATDARCGRCGKDLRKIKVSGRPTWICPACQPRP